MRNVASLLLAALCVLSFACAPTEPIRQVDVVEQTKAPITAVPTQQPTNTPTPTPIPTETPSPTPLSEDALLMQYIAGMTTTEKIGQLCMFGFSGTEQVSSRFASILATYKVGNVILYGQNISRTNSDGGFAQCRGLTKSLQAANTSDIPLLISTDVEGGNVTRFHWGTSLYSARTLGSKDDETIASDQFAYIASNLVDVGITVDLAPVLDIAKSPTDSFLGKRILSSDADVASRIGVACIEGLHAGGCLSIVKHFPGHGATNTDSHDTTPIIDRSLDSLSAYELIPFEAGLKVADGVMVGHLLYPQIDDDVASMSDVFITTLLRETYGFDGIVMSDDFRMAGLRSRYKLSDAAVQFILAGGDLILCGANHSYQEQILAGLTAAAENGTLTQARLDESVFRILRAKMRVTDWEPTR